MTVKIVQEPIDEAVQPEPVAEPVTTVTMGFALGYRLMPGPQTLTPNPRMPTEIHEYIDALPDQPEKREKRVRQPVLNEPAYGLAWVGGRPLRGPRLNRGA